MEGEELSDLGWDGRGRRRRDIDPVLCKICNGNGSLVRRVHGQDLAGVGQGVRRLAHLHIELGPGFEGVDVVLVLLEGFVEGLQSVFFIARPHFFQTLARETAWKDYAAKSESCARIMSLAEKAL